MATSNFEDGRKKSEEVGATATPLPPLIKSYTDIKQFVKQLLYRNYPNHAQPVKRAVKLTTPPSRRIAGSKKLTGEAVCPIAGRKKQWIGKNTTSQEKLLMLVNKIKAIIAIGIALIAFFL